MLSLVASSRFAESAFAFRGVRVGWGADWSAAILATVATGYWLVAVELAQISPFVHGTFVLHPPYVYAWMTVTMLLVALSFLPEWRSRALLPPEWLLAAPATDRWYHRRFSCQLAIAVVIGLQVERDFDWSPDELLEPWLLLPLFLAMSAALCALRTFRGRRERLEFVAVYPAWHAVVTLAMAWISFSLLVMAAGVVAFGAWLLPWYR
jgi:hypothetical protein